MFKFYKIIDARIDKITKLKANDTWPKNVYRDATDKHI